ncbi:unnamed protein product [Hydatigera taeniaeformis]|uniref:Prothymosin alpha n=1 Tax=Hydatigena taeniaeformis TaxID=6205 RepID=A0A0R3XCC6_HYDTA|nr:unnamed protein product [Hydatigera taeniaeformis]
MVIDEVDEDDFEATDSENDYEGGGGEGEKKDSDDDNVQRPPITLKQGVEIEEVFDESEQAASKNEMECVENSGVEDDDDAVAEDATLPTIWTCF